VDLQQHVRDAFRLRFAMEATVVVRAPGRVNLIGDHTDYNDGFVLPMTIDRAVWLAASPRTDSRVCMHSAALGECTEFALANVPVAKDGWERYVHGVAGALQQAGHILTGWQGVALADIPMGAGLSSSAALELAVARTFVELSAATWDATRSATLCQIAEHQWVGVNCGIMDQLASALGQVNHALLIDCRSLQTRALALPHGCTVVILDTGVRRGLVNSAYNQRRQQCESAATMLGVAALRDVDLTRFARDGSRLPELVRRRALHVITENERVCSAAEALRQGDAEALGQLMCASHQSLRDDFGVSCDELDAIVEIAQRQPACYGARMTGAGFGGCAVALVQAQHAQDFAVNVAQEYKKATGVIAPVYLCAATDGASVVWRADQ
jgi:galactokinase